MIDVPGAPFYDAAADAALCHGGPIAEPEDTQYVLEHTRGVAENMRRFKRITHDTAVS